jgi:hypothetical protein
LKAQAPVGDPRQQQHIHVLIRTNTGESFKNRRKSEKVAARSTFLEKAERKGF